MVYRLLRDLHLYAGLLVSPFILVFAVSAFYLNHAKIGSTAPIARTQARLAVPDGLDTLKGREAVERVKLLLPQLSLRGEIGFVRFRPADRHLVFPVTRAGIETLVDVDLDARSASVTERRTAMWEGLAYLHKMPGPHNVAVRGNWIGTTLWRVAADATVYLLLFISISGIYLWWAIRAARRLGLSLAAAGAFTLAALVYGILR